MSTKRNEYTNVKANVTVSSNTSLFYDNFISLDYKCFQHYTKRVCEAWNKKIHRPLHRVISLGYRRC